MNRVRTRKSLDGGNLPRVSLHASTIKCRVDTRVNLHRMDVAIISNADSSYGLSISQTLVRLGFRVYALGESFDDFDFEHDDCFRVPINPYDLKSALRAMQEIREREGSIHSIILNPRLERGGHRRLIEIPPGDVLDSSVANFTIPLMLTRAVAEDVANLQGFFFFLTWDRPKTGPVDPILDACGEGLKHLSDGVFSVLRVLGARACRIGIQPNANKDVPVSASSDHSQTRIQADEVADVIEAVIRSKDLNAITEIRIRPRLDRGDLRLPRTHLPVDDFQDLRLPEQDDFPPDEILIPTRKPKTYLKIAEVEFPEEDWSFDEEELDSIRDPDDLSGEGGSESERRSSKPNRRRESPENANESEGDLGEGEGQRKKRRRRRRGKRSRDPKAGDRTPDADATQSGDVRPDDAAETSSNSSQSTEKPVAESTPVGPATGPSEPVTAAPDERPDSGPPGVEEAVGTSTNASGRKRAAKKAATKRTAKKAARKSAGKKTAPRKTARKAAPPQGASASDEAGQVEQSKLVTDDAKTGDAPDADRSDD